MTILDKARTLESRIARTLSRAAEDVVGSSAREPLEIAHAIVDVVERQIQPGSRGTRLFPFNRVSVSVLAPSRDARAHFEALFAAEPSLHDRVLHRLRSAGCAVSDVELDVVFAGRTARNWDHPQFHVVAVIVTLIHCYHGYTARGGPEGVGVAVGRAIRSSIVAIVVVNFFLSLAFWGASDTVRIAG